MKNISQKEEKPTNVMCFVPAHTLKRRRLNTEGGGRAFSTDYLRSEQNSGLRRVESSQALKR